MDPALAQVRTETFCELVEIGLLQALAVLKKEHRDFAVGHREGFRAFPWAACDA